MVSVTVDVLTADWPRVDLIKIDVEGAEESVWEGMERTIADLWSALESEEGVRPYAAGEAVR